MVFMGYQLAVLVWGARCVISSSILSLHRNEDFRCDVQPVAPQLSQPFFHVLFAALVTGKKPQTNLKIGGARNVSKAMALLPRLPMANESSGILQRLAPASNDDSEIAGVDAAVHVIDGLDPPVNSSGLSVTGAINASGANEIKVPRKTEEPKSSLDADAARVNATLDKMQCIFESMLSDHCGQLKSKDAARRGPWESVCLDPKHEHDSADAYELMSAEERKYSRKIRHMTPVGHHTVELWNDNEQYKAILCMQMKIVDDECISFKKPRFFLATQGVRSTKLVRGFVDANKTRSSTKSLKKNVKIGTMSAEKDDAVKLVGEELEAVARMKQ
eukprot:gnl/MRDRNA2_/MRDRNA2_32166_c0_seq1.p1 gnl/MRDRNA2_/MRDRNA2_32166_c0~~gnl/MRDRNA2_/MRDRNA2_32166_c0_seq1.p1  ORF type:complete len:331 (+),score=73.63 gnl/MRDRNA2_/MRDRNA2_32166_c0_seq1:112-1104(+)